MSDAFAKKHNLQSFRNSSESGNPGTFRESIMFELSVSWISDLEFSCSGSSQYRFKVLEQGHPVSGELSKPQATAEHAGPISILFHCVVEEKGKEKKLGFAYDIVHQSHPQKRNEQRRAKTREYKGR